MESSWFLVPSSASLSLLFFLSVPRSRAAHDVQCALVGVFRRSVERRVWRFSVEVGFSEWATVFLVFVFLGETGSFGAERGFLEVGGVCCGLVGLDCCLNGSFLRGPVMGLCWDGL